MRKKILLSFGLLVLAYFALTWFFFGSPHPCGILETRKKPTVIKAGRDAWRAGLATLRAAAKRTNFDAEIVQELTRHVSDRPKEEQRLLSELHRQVWQMSPAACARGALTWQAPQNYKTTPESEPDL